MARRGKSVPKSGTRGRTPKRPKVGVRDARTLDTGVTVQSGQIFIHRLGPDDYKLSITAKEQPPVSATVQLTWSELIGVIEALWSVADARCRKEG